MTYLSPLPRKAGVVAFVCLLMVVGFFLLGTATHFFFLLFGGILFGVLLSSISHFFEQKLKMSYGLSLALTALLLISAIGVAVRLMAPSINAQAQELSNTLPQAIRQAETSLTQYSWGEQLVNEINTNSQKILSPQGNVVSKVTGFFSSTLGAIANFFIVLITGAFLAADPKTYKDGFARLFKPSFRSRLLEVLDQCFHTLSSWIISRSLSMLAVGVGTVIGLLALGIPMPFVLALIAAFLNLIPNIGPYIALIPALLIAYLQGPEKALYVFLLYTGVQMVESYFITPMLDKRFVSTPPALLLFGQILLGMLVGGIGLILASPLIAVLVVIINELYVKDFLEQPSQSNSRPSIDNPLPNRSSQEVAYANAATLRAKE